jgi:hypothetical protein
MAGILSIIYLILGYWACGEVLFANSNKSHVLIKLIVGVAFGWLLIPIAIIKIKTKSGDSKNANQAFQGNLPDDSDTASLRAECSSLLREFINEIEENPEEMIVYLTKFFTAQGMKFVEGVGGDEARVVSCEYINSYYLEDPREFSEEFLDKVVVLKDRISDIKVIEDNEIILTLGDLKEYSSKFGIVHIQRTRCMIQNTFFDDVRSVKVGQEMYIIGLLSKEFFNTKNEFAMTSCIPICIDKIACSKAKALCVELLKL